MARIYIRDYIDFGTGGAKIDWASYVIALDPDFKEIIDSVTEKKDKPEEFISPLPKIDGSGFYADLDVIYAKVQICVNGFVSNWFNLTPKSQNVQNVRITEKGKETIFTTSEAIGML